MRAPHRDREAAERGLPRTLTWRHPDATPGLEKGGGLIVPDFCKSVYKTMRHETYETPGVACVFCQMAG